jgi:hypothetical protein
MERSDNDETKDTGDTGRVLAAASRQILEWVE